MMTDNNSDELGYGTAAALYWEAGWRGVNPLRPFTKFPPPPGRTGHDGEDPSYADMLHYCELYQDGNLMLRMPEIIIGIDVDPDDRAVFDQSSLDPHRARHECSDLDR
jgi:hypothetical protein